ncbi:hypothetical protein SK128_004297 [Halocaridina rubra]|uniref:Uncharacterized protein n=1 Tax=Halocaridina rubra TaxID=373956 RepID=A0AAN8X9W7_HALRR
MDSSSRSGGNQYLCESCYNESALRKTSETDPFVNNRGKIHIKSENTHGADVLEQIKKERCNEIVVEPEIHFMIGCGNNKEPESHHESDRDEKDNLGGNAKQEQNAEKIEMIDVTKIRKEPSEIYFHFRLLKINTPLPPPPSPYGSNNHPQR